MLAPVDPQITGIRDLWAQLLDCLLAFFMAQAEPVQQKADGGATSVTGQLDVQFIKCQIRVLGKPLTHPCGMFRQLAAAYMTLPGGCNAPDARFRGTMFQAP